MSKTVAIIGMGRFGLSLVESFSKNNIDTIAIDHIKERAEKAGVYTPYLVVCDSTNEEALKEAGVHNADHVIVAMGQDEDFNISTSIVTVIKLKKIGCKKITVRLDDDTFLETMNLIGADDIIFPLKIASDKLANKLSSNSIVDYFKMTNDFDAYEIIVDGDFNELAITKLNARAKFLINILLIKRNGKVVVPNRETIIMPLDHLFIFGQKKDINKITKFFENK